MTNLTKFPERPAIPPGAAQVPQSYFAKDKFWRWQGRIYNQEDPPNVRTYEQRFRHRDWLKDGLRSVLIQPREISPAVCELIDDSQYGRLWRLSFIWGSPSWNASRRSDITMLEVWNSTLEKDGSRQRFLLRVPRHIRSAHQAVAWTFNMTPAQYSPEKET